MTQRLYVAQRWVLFGPYSVLRIGSFLWEYASFYFFLKSWTIWKLQIYPPSPLFLLGTGYKLGPPCSFVQHLLCFPHSSTCQALLTKHYCEGKNHVRLQTQATHDYGGITLSCILTHVYFLPGPRCLRRGLLMQIHEVSVYCVQNCLWR